MAELERLVEFVAVLVQTRPGFGNGKPGSAEARITAGEAKQLSGLIEV